MAGSTKDKLNAFKNFAVKTISDIDVDAIVDKASEAKNFAVKEASKIDLGEVKEKAVDITGKLTEKGAVVKEAAITAKTGIEEKLHELDKQLEEAISEYNNAFTLMNDKGLQLYMLRTQSLDTIDFIESLVNSIANTPKSFEADFNEINENRRTFVGTAEFADKELSAARTAAGGAGAGLAAGASVAFMAPSAAMWVATTFGTASTGVAISTLSGAAAQSAALAWLGGGALAANGGGMAAGTALLALSGPIGWGIAGASLLTTIVLFSRKRVLLDKQKNEELESVKKNTEKVKEMDAGIAQILNNTSDLRKKLNESYLNSVALYNKDYKTMSEDEKLQLGAIVNNTKALSALLKQTI